MSVATKDQASRQVFNVPNQLTAARLLLAIVLFFLIPLGHYMASTVIFLIAASTDWLDGYWARKYGQVTTLGRILDPFVDKIIVCGAFIFLAAVPSSHVKAWMAVVIVGRELLVTALRNFLEGEGADFSAQMSGKLKMVAQCAAAALSLYLLTYTNSDAVPDGLETTTKIAVWSAVALTVYSGVEYIRRAIQIVRRMTA